MTKQKVRNLEIHANHSCNLFCESCSHYSSLGADRGPTASTCIAWMELWSDRLAPDQFSILGGEPTLNPRLTDIVQAAGEIWPNSEIRVVTNGFLLWAHPQLPRVLDKIGPRTRLDVSKHHSSPEYTAKFAPVLDLLDSWKDFSFRINLMPSDEKWTRRYYYENGKLTLPDGDPRKAWKCCIGKHCRQLFAGYLWKCPQIAYFDMMTKNAEVDERWINLVGTYKPLKYTCSDEELSTFLALQDEPVCAICPNELVHFDLPNPLVNIRAAK